MNDAFPKTIFQTFDKEVQVYYGERNLINFWADNTVGCLPFLVTSVITCTNVLGGKRLD